ncbi:helix-turn-helix domain-containing protein [Thermocatellispora tengchongensis]|uniref:helix-turn-helix domain-containing protein n=1 Tax=Thermocatellispora tengchongensis TaxID=1073253 RepID=UPI0036439125
MPGGRLTYEDRQAIASGLADGLDYAEIARRLARPTSTVTREVARNGGPCRLPRRAGGAGGHTARAPTPTGLARARADRRIRPRT